MSSGIVPPTAARRIAAVGTFNLRDVGGYPVGDDRMTAWGRLYRSDVPGPGAVAPVAVVDLGLSTVIDLRSDGERLTRPSSTAEGVATLHRSLGIGVMVAREPGLASSLGGLYAAAVQHLGTQIAAAVSDLVEPGALPALVHCTAGKDRTGITIALVLSALGVDDETVAADYAVTADLLTPAFFSGVDPGEVVPPGQVDLTPLYRADAAAVLEMLQVVRGLAGSARGYLEHHGVSPTNIDRFKQEMVVPRPQAVRG